MDLRQLIKFKRRIRGPRGFVFVYILMGSIYVYKLTELGVGVVDWQRHPGHAGGQGYGAHGADSAAGAQAGLGQLHVRCGRHRRGDSHRAHLEW